MSVDEFFLTFDGNTIPSFENGEIVFQKTKSTCFIRIIDEINKPLIIICCCIKSTKKYGSITNKVENISQEVFKKLNVKKEREDSALWIEHYPPKLGLAENGSYQLVRNPQYSPDWTSGVSPRQLSEFTGLPEEIFIVKEDIYSM